MLNYLKTAIEFTKNISETGAFTETSKSVVNEISQYVDKEKKQIIIEFGAGHGNITLGILSKMHPNSILYAFETNTEFCSVLSKISDERLRVVNMSAQHIKQIVEIENSVDCIISSIPFTFIPDEVLNEILYSSFYLLKPNNYMTQVLYSQRHIKHYKKFFRNCTSKTVLNFPLAQIYSCQK
jgi:phospholipid N-methyltransferase